jgi:hypothetical protein
MGLAFGILLILAGALAYHIASTGTAVHTPVEVWRDMVKLARGQAIS